MKLRTTHEKKEGVKGFFRSLSIGFFLAYRDVRKANIWTTLLIITVMVLTFLNLIVVSGILVGLIQGSSDANRQRYAGDVIVSTLPKKTYIERSADTIRFIQSLPGVTAVSARYIESGKIEANYKNRTRLSDKVDQAGGLVVGIVPEDEIAVSQLNKYVIEGDFLEEGDSDEVLLGANLLFKYTPIDSPGISTLKNVEVGSKVRLIINGTSREVTIKGVIKSKVGENDQRIYMVASELRKIIGRNDYNVDEISIRLVPGADASKITSALISQGIDQTAKVQTWEQSEPKFLKDIKATFAILGNLIGSIGLAVASITIFIIIFVNAITRRRFIGILKGIGIRSLAIEISYIIQSLFYALCGIVLGSAIIFLFLKPYILAHPINFPFSDGILVATLSGTLLRAGILIVATLIAGYIPARLVVKQNTLDAILGR
ncbi:MAG: ABC transporter permease [Candidatus Taylorbacteria bacterium]|nr:ABC transporter permease [Candidatus Taylorbacteria bacterium]